ncbi:hypothetical protein AB0933_19730 [Streptomyces venezuelae]|uniref:hypothetical protein n=1 Tax=Streptomyces venezuelae TaxID=54571 RepID=UPI003455A006
MSFKHSVLAATVALTALTGTLAVTQAQASEPSPPKVSPEAKRVYHTTEGLKSCPKGRFCTETKDRTTNSWKVHEFWKCGLYTLYNWEDVGAYINNQDDAKAKVYNKDMKLVWPEIPSNNKKGWGNWSDAWFIRPC